MAAFCNFILAWQWQLSDRQSQCCRYGDFVARTRVLYYDCLADNILFLMEKKFLATSNDFLVVQNHARTGDRFYFVTKSLK